MFITEDKKWNHLVFLKALIISKTLLCSNRGFTCTGYLCINIDSDVLKYIFKKKKKKHGSHKVNIPQSVVK